MMVALLLGILSLGACVEDKESASVTDVREAKAEQLKSIAAMNDATAEATKLLAEADAAMKAAQTEAIKTQTELAEVNVQLAQVNVELAQTQVEEEKVKLEQLKVDLETKQADLEQHKAEISATLQTIAANLEVNLMQAKVALQQAQIEFNSNLSTLDAQERAKLTTLMTTYTNASNNLLSVQQQLALEKSHLAILESGLVNNQETNALMIKGYQAQIANYQALIDLAKSYTGMTKEQAAAQYNDANNQLSILSAKSDASSSAYSNATRALSNARNAVNGSAYYTKLNSSQSDMLNAIWTIPNVSSASYSTSISYTKSVNGQSVKVTLVDYAATSESPEIIADDGVLLGTYSYFKITKYYSLNKAGFDTFIVDLTKVATDAATATTTAKEALDADPDNTTLQTTYANAQALQTNAENELKNIQDIYTYLSAQASAYDKLAGDYMDRIVNVYTDYAQYLKDDHNSELQYQKYLMLQNIMYSAFDVDGKIANYESNIAQLNVWITGIQNTNNDSEASIENSKLTITKLETQITVLQKQVDTAKAALDAAMK